MNWIFNENSFGQKITDERNQMISFTQKRKYGATVGEGIIILEQTKQGWGFTKSFEIEDIQHDNVDYGYTKITITVRILKVFPQTKPIEEYAYSLLRVTNFKNPQNHFNNRKYSRIEDVEYNAIVTDDIYTKRTVLGTVLNALHPTHQQAFIMNLAEIRPQLVVNKINVDTVLQHLVDYVNDNIIEPISYLKSSAELFSELFDKDAIGSLCFGSDPQKDDNESLKLIPQQLVAINEHFSALLLLNTDKVDDQSKQEKEFRKLFRNSRLPINI